MNETSPNPFSKKEKKTTILVGVKIKEPNQTWFMSVTLFLNCIF